jgi:hypothetical protein
VDTQTRHALKQDKLVQATATGFEWFHANRSRALQLMVSAVVVLAAIVVGLVIYNQRSTAADSAFGQAMDLYNAPLAQPGQPAAPGAPAFSTLAERAKAANQRFVDLTNRYGSLAAGKRARYFVGLTFMDMGQNGNAESALEQVAGGNDADMAALAKVALASLYEQTNRTSQAVVLYKQLIAKPTSTVSTDAAQLQLAALYETTNPAEAKRIYAQLKNEKTAAGEIAAQKLAQK